MIEYYNKKINNNNADSVSKLVIIIMLIKIEKLM